MLNELPRLIGQRRGCCALVAINQRVRCKSRLDQRLSVSARVELVRAMLGRVLAAASCAQTVRQIFVVSPERDLVPTEVPVLADTGEGLNAALTQAHRTLLKLGCCEILVLPADLPCVTGPEIDTLVHAGRRGGFAIAPDAADQGTNALCLTSSQPFQFQFGLHSRRLHLEEAARVGLVAEVVRLPGLAFDVDSPTDLRRLREEPWRTLLQA